MYSLEAPSNYVGSVATFGTSDEVRTDGLHELDDVDDLIPLGHRSQLFVSELPESLIDAVRTFLLSNAIRDLRGDADQLASMLVNVSRYKNVQRQVFDLLSDQVSRIRTAIELHHAEHATGHSEIAALRRRFEDEYSRVRRRLEDVLAVLPSSTSDVRVLLFNSDKDIRLDQDDLSWERPTRMIAVGGDVLSRGLTLDGLCVSYFYRRVDGIGHADADGSLVRLSGWLSRTSAAFGSTPRSADNYRFSADAIEDLRTDLRIMLRQQRTPEDFGLAVKKHPGALLITARNKMKNAQIARKVIGLAGRRLETTSLVTDQGGGREGVERRNRDALLSLVAVAEETAEYGATPAGWHRWLAVDKAHIADLLDSYAAPLSDPFFSGSTLSVWTRRNRVARFATWDLVIAQGQAHASTASVGARQFPLSKRQLTADGDVVRVSGKSRRLAGPTDLKGLVDARLAASAEAKFKKANPGKATPERIYYPDLDRPALVVYALERPANPDDYLVALKVAIPGDPTDVKNPDGEVEYLINTVAQEQWLTEFQGADDDDVDA